MEPTLTDITAPEVVELRIRADGKVVWVNVDGVCRLRACQIKQLVFEDDRDDQTYKMLMPVEDILDSLKRFPQGSVVSLPDSMSPSTVQVYTPETYGGENCFDVFAPILPDWSKPDNEPISSDTETTDPTL